jgi:hypothetical protein
VVIEPPIAELWDRRIGPDRDRTVTSSSRVRNHG